MIIPEQYKNKIVGIIGLAKTGMASINSLLAAQAKIFAWDDNHRLIEQIISNEERNYKEAIDNKQLIISEPTTEEWKTLSLLIVSPGIPINSSIKHAWINKAEEFSIPIISDIELLQISQPNASYIGITGTNGKSTTTALINHVFQSVNKTTQLGGNIGVPALSLNQLENIEDYYIIEASSFQLDLCSNMHFNVAICINITPDHLDRHDTFANYVNAKCKIFANQQSNDFAIIGINNETTNQIFLNLKTSAKQNVIPVSNISRLKNGVSIINNTLYDDYKSHLEYDIDNMPGLIGLHNRENMAIAFAACVAVGINPDDIIKAFSTFKALPHRMEVVHSKDNLQFINDSKATNSNSTYWALKSYNNIYWIAGGISKDIGMKQLIFLLDRIKHAYLIGKAAEEFAAVLAKYNVPHTITFTLEGTLQEIKKTNISEGNILLSPACASFDQWKNFEERGDAFVRLVHQYWK